MQGIHAPHVAFQELSQMKKLLLLCLIIVAPLTTAQGEDLAATISELEKLKADIELQMERINMAQETADERVALAKERMLEQLRAAEESLQDQIDLTKEFLATMPDKMREAGDAVKRATNELQQSSTKVASQLQARKKEAENLIRRLQNARTGLTKSLPDTAPPTVSTALAEAPKPAGKTSVPVPVSPCPKSVPPGMTTVAGAQPVPVPAPEQNSPNGPTDQETIPQTNPLPPGG